MGFADSIGRKALPDAPTLNSDVPAYPVPPGQAGKPYRDGWDVRRAVDQGLNRSTWVYRCVGAISGNSAKLPMIMRQDNPISGPEINTPLTDLFNFKTSPYESALIWRKRLSQQVLLNRQGAMVEVIRSRFGEVLALYLLPAGYTWPIPNEKTFVSAFRVQFPGKSWYDVPAENVIWIREPHPTDPYAGLTPLEAAGLAVETEWYAKLYNRNFLLNDGRPGGILVVKGEMDDDDIQEVRRRFAGPSGWGVGAAGRIAVIEGDDGADFVDTATSPRDAQWLEGKQDAKQEILEAFGVPESVIGNASGRTYDNADAELEVFWRETMLPHLELIARALDDLDTDPRLYFGFDLSRVHVLDRDQRDRRTFTLSEKNANVITTDEYREETGREPLGQGAGKLYMPLANVEIADSASVTPYNHEVSEYEPALRQAGRESGSMEAKILWQLLERVLGGAEAKAGPGGAPVNTGVMVALYPDAKTASALALDGGEPSTELHVTLAYLGKAVDLANPDALAAAVQMFASSAPALDGEVSGIGRFTAADDEHVLYASVDVPALPSFRERLVAVIEAAGVEVNKAHGFTPHMTLSYIDPEDPTPELIPDAVPLHFDSIYLVVGEHVERFRLLGTETKDVGTGSPVGGPALGFAPLQRGGVVASPDPGKAPAPQGRSKPRRVRRSRSVTPTSPQRIWRSGNTLAS